MQINNSPVIAEPDHMRLTVVTSDGQFYLKCVPAIAFSRDFQVRAIRRGDHRLRTDVVDIKIHRDGIIRKVQAPGPP